MSQQFAQKSASKSKKKRKKSAITSPTHADSNINKKSKLLPDGDVDTDIEYLSAPEYSESSHPRRTMDANQQPPITAFTTTSSKITQGAKFTLREEDREDIAERVRSKINANPEEIAQRVRSHLKDDLAELIQQIIQPLKDDLSHTKTLLMKEIDKNDILHSEVNDLKLALDEQEQYSRRSCLRINGVIGDEGSPTEQVETKLLTLADTYNIPMKPEDIDVAHRVGKPKPGYTRPVIVKFANSKARQRVLTARKSFDNVYVNEDLTRYRQSLHYYARKLVKDKKLDRTWIAGGKFFCSFPSSVPGTRVQIRSMDDIECIRNGKPLKPFGGQQ
ncbi:MAG: hypothetical protein ABW185_14800 [Sedimenticola sp.]